MIPTVDIDLHEHLNQWCAQGPEDAVKVGCRQRGADNRGRTEQDTALFPTQWRDLPG